MESKWYYFPGQTQQNTKISDRAHALHITKAAWSNITQHLDRKKRIQEAIDKEKAHKEALKQGSEAMWKKWPNSVQNLRLRKEEDRRHRFEDRKKEDKLQMFYKMRAEQEVVRKEYVDKIKKEMFLSSGHPKELTTALILSETLFEREKQKEFNDRIKKHEKEVHKQFDADILASDAKEQQKEIEKQQKIREVGRKLGEMLRNQIKQSEETRKSNRREHIEKETRDRIKAAEEEELIKEYEFTEKMRKRREIALGKKNALMEERKRQQVLAKENDEMEKATEFCREAKHRIDCLLKIKEKEMREEAVERNKDLAAEVAIRIASQGAAEDARIAKVIAEREAEEKEKAKAKAAFKAQMIRDRVKDRKVYTQKVEHEKAVDEEMKRWEMLNRIKTAEVMKEYDEQNRKAKWAKVLEYRRDLLEQMADERAIQKEEKKIDEIMSHVSFEEADRMFFDYANEVMELAKSKKRPTYPIEKVISDYKTFNRLSTQQRPRCYKK